MTHMVGGAPSRLYDVRSQMAELAGELIEGARQHIDAVTEDLCAAAGQFSGAITGGAADFQACWQVVAEVLCDGTMLVANNTGRVGLALERIDAAYASVLLSQRPSTHDSMLL